MALIEKKLVTEREAVTYKLDRDTVELVRLYSEFIGSPQEHVVNESLRFVFRKDKDFAEWLKTKKMTPSTKEMVTKGKSETVAATANKA